MRAVGLCFVLAACSAAPSTTPPPPDTDGAVAPIAANDAASDASAKEESTGELPDVATPPPTGAIEHVLTIAFENEASGGIYGNALASYFNTLISTYAAADDYVDDLASAIPSEPHYVEMEAATNAFSDYTYTLDVPPSASNSSKTKAHLSNLLDAAGISWRAYEEGIDPTTGACPVANGASNGPSDSNYVARHDPFVLFQDVSFTNGQPDPNNAYCKGHVVDFSQLAGDIANDTIARYDFITPNLCDDMHVQGCGNENVQQKVIDANAWLETQMKYILPYVLDESHHAVLFLIWDEPEGLPAMPFVVVSPHVASAGYRSKTALGHASYVRSLQEIFGVSPANGVPFLGKAGGVNDFSDFFQKGYFP
ncbi:MAG TPA: alkaline phosphatase family protein [Polyangiaceae bacterium]|jgi:acid phosphatase|nr:alkaline phosphatase family protein [Polyangiaceae bacterium]